MEMISHYFMWNVLKLQMDFSVISQSLNMHDIHNKTEL